MLIRMNRKYRKMLRNRKVRGYEWQYQDKGTAKAVDAVAGYHGTFTPAYGFVYFPHQYKGRSDCNLFYSGVSCDSSFSVS